MLLSRNVECGNDGDYGKTGVGAHALLSQRLLAVALLPRRVNISLFLALGLQDCISVPLRWLFWINISLKFSVVKCIKLCHH